MKYLQYVDYLMANETETEFLTDLPVNDDDEIKKAAVKLLDMGVKTVIMTLGSRGAYFKNIQEEGFIDGYQVDAVDTTAAGDVFSGSFTSAIVEGKSMAEALRFANAAAAVSVTRLGAMPSAPTRKEIEDFLVKQQ
jgi:ribokinase